VEVVGMNGSIKSKGFSLIEMLIAIVILSISLLSLATLMVTTTRGNSFGSHVTEATMFGQDKLEEFRAMPWVAIPNGQETDQRTGATGVDFTRTWNVATNGNLKTINITVSWNDGTSRSIPFTSVVGE